MGETVRLRSRHAQTLAVAMVAAAVLALTLSALDGPRAVATYAAPVALFGLLGWAAFWAPYVEVSDGGVEVANTLRTVQVPWPSVESVEGRYGLRLLTTYGPVTAWAASAPTGRDRAGGGRSVASTAVETRLGALREAGHLEQRRLELTALPVHWNLGVLVTGSVLAVVTAAQLVARLVA